LQQHEVIYLIVLGFAAAGIAAMLFFCEESNAGNFRRAVGEPAACLEASEVLA